MKRILVLVVTYNRKELLRENIENMLNQSYKKFDFAIVDNASTDGTEEVVKSFKDKRIKYYNTGKNLGGAGGFNYGLRIALENNYDYCWLMDDDTIPMNDALENMINKSKVLKNDFSFLSGYVQWIDETVCKMNLVKINKKWGEKAHLLKKEGLLPIRSGTFVSTFINLNIAKNTALPVKQMFIYNDDHEYTGRLSKLAPAYYVLDSVVTHKMTSNYGFEIVDVPKERISRYFYDSRNRFYVGRKNGLYEILYYFYWLITSTIRIITKSRDKKLKRIHVIWKGFIHGLFFFPKMEYIKKEK